jgi:DNA mismatch repair protein MutS2
MEADFHGLLAELKEMGRRREEKLRELEERERLFHEQEMLLKESLAEAGRKERESLEKAWLEAKEIVRGAKREVNAILEQARRERGRLAKKEMEDVERRVDEKLAEMHPEESLQAERLETGMVVFVKSIGYDATITAIDRKHGRLRVRAGRMDMEIHLSDAAPKKGRKAQPKSASRKEEHEVSEPREINVIGLRVDDALPEVERFLNRLSLKGGGEARIVHGRGTGALMRGVRDYLDEHPLVLEYRKGEQFEGGDGVTLVTLR